MHRIHRGLLSRPGILAKSAAVPAVLTLLSVISRENYPLFHLLVEGSSIMVGLALFLLIWTARRLLQSSPLVLLGIALLFVGGIDLLHALAYKGMAVLHIGADANPATQLWIAGRWLQSFSVLAFALLIGRYRLKPTPLFWGYAAVSSTLVFLVWTGRFPDCYVEPAGLTPFKIWSEYLICGVFGAAVVVLRHRRRYLDAAVGRTLAWAVGIAIASEVAFTQYVGVFGPMNMVGHLLKTASFFLVYLALIQAHLKRPIETLFLELSQAKAVAENSRLWLERVSETTPDIIFVLDVILNRNVYANRSITKMLGWSPAEFRNLPDVVERSIHPEDVARAAQFFRDMNAAHPGEVRRLTHRALHKDGTPRWLEVEVTPFSWDESGRLKEVIGIARDVSGRKAAEDRLIEEKREIEQARAALAISERRFRLLSETASRLLSAEDPQTCIDALCNDVMAHLGCDVFVNFLADEASGRLHLNACAGIPDEERRRIVLLDYGVAVCGCVAQERRRIIADRILASDDPRVALVKSLGVQAYCCHPVMAQGQLVGTLSFGSRSRDRFGDDEVELMRIIADQVSIAMQRLSNRNALRASEAALRAANETLEIKVRERTASLTAANRELDARAGQLRALAGELTTAEQRERKRLARVLHDGLQQQLAAAKLQVGMIAAHPSPDAAVKVVEQLLGEAIQMSRSLSAELSPPVLQEGGLAAGLEWLGRVMQERHAFRIETAIEARPDFPDDTKILLFEAVRELLYNAVKHSGAPGARVRLHRRNDVVHIAVSDDGEGFDPAGVGAGSGCYGLFSVRERLSLVGGELRVDSAPGQGSRFTIVLPAGVMAAASEPAGSPGGIRVMIVDDHTIFREGLARLCRQAGDIDVVGQADNGRDAIALTRELVPDVILMDVSMPGLNGIEATRAIHALAPEVRIIGLSMHADPAVEKDLLDAGASRYLNKGCRNAELLSAIRRAWPGDGQLSAAAAG